jgi:hypothetical protein
MNYSSQLIQNSPQYVPPVSLDILAHGVMHQKDQADKAANNLTAQLDNIANMPTLPGADTDIKNQALQKLTESVNGLASNDLSNSNVQAQIKQNINSITSNPDFQNVVQRGNDYHQKLKKYNDLTEKGETVSAWNALPLQKYQNYIAQGKYIKNYDFSGDIYKSADFNKILDEAAKETHATNEFKPDASGLYTDETETKYQAALAANIKRRFQNDPQAYAEFQRKFNFEHQNTPWENTARMDYGKMASDAGTNAQNAYGLANIAASKHDMVGYKTHILDAQKAEAQYAQWAKMAKDPDVNKYKNDLMEQTLNNYALDNAQSYAYSTLKSHKEEAYRLKDYEQKLAIGKHIQEQVADRIIPGALNPATGEATDPSLIINGIHTPKGLKAAQEAATRTNDLELEKAQAHSDIIEQRQKNLLQTKAEIKKLANTSNNPKVAEFNNLLKNAENLSAKSTDVQASVNKTIQEWLNDPEYKAEFNIPKDDEVTKVKLEGDKITYSIKGHVWDTEASTPIDINSFAATIGDRLKPATKTASSNNTQINKGTVR